MTQCSIEMLLVGDWDPVVMLVNIRYILAKELAQGHNSLRRQEHFARFTWCCETKIAIHRCTDKPLSKRSMTLTLWITHETFYNVPCLCWGCTPPGIYILRSFAFLLTYVTALHRGQSSTVWAAVWIGDDWHRRRYWRHLCSERMCSQKTAALCRWVQWADWGSCCRRVRLQHNQIWHN